MTLTTMTTERNPRPRREHFYSRRSSGVNSSSPHIRAPNHRAPLDAAIALCLHSEGQWRRASEPERSAAQKVVRDSNLLILCFLTVSGFSGCVSERSPEVRGHVVDAVTHQPLQGA